MLLCAACDIPAGRKLCGFKGCNANLGCWIALAPMDLDFILAITPNIHHVLLSKLLYLINWMLSYEYKSDTNIYRRP